MQELRHSALKCLFEEKLVLLMLMMRRRRIQWAELARCKMIMMTYHNYCNNAATTDDEEGGRVGEWRESDARVGGGEHEVPSLQRDLLGRVCLLCLCSQLLLLCASSAQQSLLLWFSSQQSLLTMHLLSTAEQSLLLICASSAHCASAQLLLRVSLISLLCSTVPQNWRSRKQHWSPILLSLNLSFPGTGLQNDSIFILHSISTTTCLLPTWT